MNRTTSGAIVVLLACAALIMAATWAWHARVFHTGTAGVAGDPWEQVKQAYPLAETPPELAPLSAQSAQAVIQANPFSPERRRLPAQGDDGTGGEGTTTSLEPPPKPHFLYKGRINVGKRQRAILEEVSTHKTYFLEVGQEVAGFKVLDITQKQVLLSDPNTHEEVVVSLASSER